MRLIDLFVPALHQLEAARTPGSVLTCARCGHTGRDVAWGLDQTGGYELVTTRCIDSYACAGRRAERGVE